MNRSLNWIFVLIAAVSMWSCERATERELVETRDVEIGIGTSPWAGVEVMIDLPEEALDPQHAQGRLLQLILLDPAGGSCEGLLSGTLDPDAMTVIKRQPVDGPTEGQTLLLERVAVGEWFFFARLESPGGRALGCSLITVPETERISGVVSMEWSCRTGGDEIPGNELDDDCDGLTDECETPDDCDDGNPCTQDLCSGFVCNYADLNVGPCDDNDECTENDGCLGGVCQGQARDCATSECNGICVAGLGCVDEPWPDGSPCEDNIFCTETQSCLAGVCEGEDRTCDDGNICTEDVCNEGGLVCEHEMLYPQANCGVCDVDALCDDDNECTVDTCQDNLCVNTPVDDDTQCSDGLYCTVADVCISGQCTGQVRDCTAEDDLCNEGVCDEDGQVCIKQPRDGLIPCDDGRWCTTGDQCQDGVCAGVERDCADGDHCTADSCVEALERCDHTPQQLPGAEGPLGDPSCANSVDDDCDGLTDDADSNCITCTEASQCDDGNVCTNDDCNVQEGLCEYSDNDGVSCDDGLYCSDSDTCQGGLCTGPALDCDDGDSCTLDACDEDGDTCESALQPLPGELDLCGDGIDQDCDGIVDSCCGNDGSFEVIADVCSVQGDTCRLGGWGKFITSDLNADGIPDLLSMGDNEIYIRLGNGQDGVGDGSFGVLGTKFLPLYSNDVALGDFNADGITDMAVVGDDDLAVLIGGGSEGRGDGTFTDGQIVDLEYDKYCVGIVTTDLNNDGILDLVVSTGMTHGGDHYLQWIMGQGSDGRGNGTFSGRQLLILGERWAGPIVSGDFNADGAPDVALLTMLGSCPAEPNDNHWLEVILNDGNGDFFATSHSSFDLDFCQPELLAVADFTGDAILDLLVHRSPNDYSGEMRLFSGNGSNGRGTGSFLPFAQRDDVPGNGLALADYDGDGLLDVAIGSNSNSPGAALVVSGREDGTFGSPVEVGPSSSVNKIASDDVNADGATDIFVTSGTYSDLDVLLSAGSGSRPDGSLGPVTVIGLPDRPQALAVADFNADRIPDLAVARAGSEQLSIMLGQGIPAHGAGNYVIGDTTGLLLSSAPVAIDHGDFDGDAIADLAVLTPGIQAVSILLGGGSNGRGDGTFGGPSVVPVGAGASALLVADFDEDHVLDLAVAESTGNAVSVHLGDGPNGNGNGSFMIPPASADTGLEPVALASGDFNADSRLDLAVVNRGAGTVSVLLANGADGRGDGTFGAAQDFSVGTSPMAVVVGDFDGDSILDLAVVNQGSNDVSVLLGNGTGGQGDGTFAAAVSTPAGSAPEKLVVADMDRDHILDLLVGNPTTGELQVLLGNGSDGWGDGTFTLVGTYTLGLAVGDLALADLTGDGMMDVVVVDPDLDSMAVLLGQGVCSQ